MIRKPLKALVCLLFPLLMGLGNLSWGYTSSDIADSMGVQADALSAESRLLPSEPDTSSYSSGSNSSSQSSFPRYTTRRSTTRFPKYSQHRPRRGYCPPGGYCPPSSNFGLPSLPSLPSLFPLGGLGCLPGLKMLRPLSCNSALPRIGCKQFELVARLWSAKLNSTNIIWGANPATGAGGTQFDLHRILDLGKQMYIPEYEARFQIRPHWGVRYSFMHINDDDHHVVNTPGGGFYFGNILYPNGAYIFSRWERYIHRGELVYDWFSARHAVASIFAGYSMYDDELIINMQPNISRRRSRAFGLVHAGMELHRIVGDLSGGTASTLCRWSAQFMDDYFGWDAMAMLRISVPMGYRRFGYLEAGWRWMVLERELPADTDSISMDGIIGSVGMVF